MNDLKKYLNENRDVIDGMEPLDGHFDRFEERLNSRAREKKRKKATKVKLYGAVSVAASIALVATGIWMYKQQPDNAGEIFSEFVETEVFYRTQMDKQIAGIYCKLAETDAETQSLLTKDLEEIVENTDTFVEEIRDAKDGELAIYYLVEHYEANLDALRFINNKLEEYF
jgi:hypothetical protein